MILRFGVENYRSIRDRVEMSFASTSRKDEPSLRLEAQGTTHGAMPVVGIWGANASGKSNLLLALKEIRAAVSSSFIGLKPGESVPWKPWRMRTHDGAPATTMDIDFLVKGIRYHFGFRLSSRGFIEEWLYGWPEGRRRVIYHRNHDEKEPWYLGPSLRGNREEIKSATRSNCLFLSAAAQFNHPLLSEVYEVVASGIVDGTPLAPEGYPTFFSDDQLLDPRFKSVVVDLLGAADLGVHGFDAVEKPQAAKRMREHLSEFLRQTVIDEMLADFDKRGSMVELRLQHGAGKEDTWELDPRYESRGTWVFLWRLNDLFKILLNGHMLVIDEIDTSLHPDLCGALVDLFTNATTNLHGAQLLFTTHDRNLMTRLRTDEVVLVDKYSDGVTRLTAASDFKDVRTRDDLRLAHEQGRLRGVPVLGDLIKILSEELARES